MKIGLDKDGVLCRYNARFCYWLGVMYGIKLLPGEITTYQFDQNHPDITYDMVRNIIFNVIINEEQRNLEPILPTIALLKQLYNDFDIEYTIVTKTIQYGSHYNDLWHWAGRIQLPLDDIIICEHKTPYLKKLQFDYYIEDCPHYALHYAQNCPDTKVLLMNRTYNSNIDCKQLSNLYRVSDEYELEKIIKGIY